MFKLNNLKSPFGSNHAPKRKGRGIGSGNGKTAGKGHKGQNARSGSSVGPTFEGGQVPLQRRSPKVGFNSPLAPLNVRLSVTELGFWAGSSAALRDLVPKRLAGKSRIRVSIFGTRLPSKLPISIEAHHVSPSASKALEAKGVKIQIVEHKDGARPRVKKKKENKKA